MEFLGSPVDASGRTLLFQPLPLIGVMRTSAADTIPGCARSFSNKSPKTAGRRSLGYFAVAIGWPGAVRNVTRTRGMRRPDSFVGYEPIVLAGRKLPYTLLRSETLRAVASQHAISRV